MRGDANKRDPRLNHVGRASCGSSDDDDDDEGKRAATNFSGARDSHVRLVSRL